MMTLNMSQQVMEQEHNKKVLHREVLRVRDEDLRMQEGITTGERLNIVKDGVSDQLRAVVLSRPFLPCSPLGGAKPNCAAVPVKAMPMQP